MNVEFIRDRKGERTVLLQINGAKICFRNFKGEKSMYNKEGDKNFSVIIPDEEIADALTNDLNELGVGWKIKIRAAREEGEAPFRHMPVKVKYTENSRPNVYLVSGNSKVELNEDTIGMLDEIDIDHVDLDIRPYDDNGMFGPFRSAYLQGIWVIQDLTRDRFAARFAEGRDDRFDEED